MHWLWFVRGFLLRAHVCLSRSLPLRGAVFQAAKFFSTRPSSILYLWTAGHGARVPRTASKGVFHAGASVTSLAFGKLFLSPSNFGTFEGGGMASLHTTTSKSCHYLFLSLWPLYKGTFFPRLDGMRILLGCHGLDILNVFPYIATFVARRLHSRQQSTCFAPKCFCLDLAAGACKEFLVCTRCMWASSPGAVSHRLLLLLYGAYMCGTVRGHCALGVCKSL